MTNFSGENLNAACGGPQGGGVDSRRNGVSEVSPKYLAEVASNAIRSGYKQTEVGVIPADWDAVCLGDVSEVRMCKRILAGQTQKIGAIPFFKIGTFGGEPDAFIPQFLYEDFKAKYSFPDKGDILISAAGTLGKSVIYDGMPAYFQDSNIVWLKVNQRKLLNEYLYHYYKVIKWASSEGSTIARLYNGIIRASMIALPATHEQIAIANALSDVDALISELEKLIAKKQAIKTATMQQLLTGRTRLPQFALRDDGSPTNSSGTNLDAGTGGPKGEGQDGLRKGTKPSELGEIPEDWDAIKMGDLAKIQRGASPRPIDSPIWFERNSTVGWLRISDVTKTSKYLTETTQSLSELGIANSRFVPENNLVMSICATVGKPIITKKDLCIHDGFVVFNGLSVNQDFMYYILKELEDEWSKQGQTGSQMNLNTDLINGTYVAVPKDKAEQTAIATILSDMDAEIQALEQRLGKTRQIKQGMMQELLTGKTRLPYDKE